MLSLFDPNRSGSPIHAGLPASWGALDAVLLRAMAGDGAGVALLTGPVASPTMARQLGTLLRAKPGLGWYGYRTTSPALEVRTGAGDADAAQIWPDFARIDTVVSVGADPLGAGPAQIAFAKGWSQAKRDRREAFRSHAFEAHVPR